MDRIVFVVLNFRVTYPTVNTFLECILAEQDPTVTPAQRQLAHYVAQTLLVVTTYGEAMPSHLAKAIAYVSRWMLAVSGTLPLRTLSARMRHLVAAVVRAFQQLHEQPTTIADNAPASWSADRTSSAPPPTSMPQRTVPGGVLPPPPMMQPPPRLLADGAAPNVTASARPNTAAAVVGTPDGPTSLVESLRQQPVSTPPQQPLLTVRNKFGLARYDHIAALSFPFSRFWAELDCLGV